MTNVLSLEQGWRRSVGCYYHQHTHSGKSHGDGLIYLHKPYAMDQQDRSMAAPPLPRFSRPK